MNFNLKVKILFWFCLFVMMTSLTLGWFAIQAGRDAINNVMDQYEWIERQIEDRRL